MSLQTCLKMYLYCMKKNIKMFAKYGKAILNRILGQNTNIF